MVDRIGEQIRSLLACPRFLRFNSITTNLYAQAEQETQKYALAAAIGAVGARFTARGPAPPTMLCAVAAAGVDRRSASADDDAQTV